ncbi:arylesterase [Pusillimonas sp. SM2304]|uniref:arylesterase n=1 Tax=Pusillimonas sp. SM2304 TaxID=3073241 RepID=UPI0038F5F74D
MALLCGFQWSGTLAWADTPTSNRKPVILVVGDSLSAEYGLQRGSGWVALIEQRLRSENAAYQIRNTSISGDTSSGGVSRLPAALSEHQPDIVIIELGANDALRGLSLGATEDNLSKMISLSQEAQARVLLLGMQIPPNYGRQYAEQFQALFPRLASRHNTQLAPFLMEGMAADRNLFQADGIHPNEQAQPILADNVWEQLGPMIAPQPARQGG